MNLILWAAPVIGALGVALTLDTVPWFRRQATHARVGPYLRDRDAQRMRPDDPVMSTPQAARALFGPSAHGLSERLGALLGRNDDLATRLRRAGREPDAATFRVRQLIRALLAVAGAVAVTALTSPPLPTALALIGAAASGAVFMDEHSLSSAIRARSATLQAELVVVVEQLGLLLSAGHSVPGAIARVAERSNGVAADDLARVGRRIRGGMSDTEALAEWAERSDLDAVRRLTAVLALHREAGDLGALIATEARSLRAAAHRDLLEVIERRSQLVWVPVTVATLVPGLLFLAVPFMSAMDQVVGR